MRGKKRIVLIILGVIVGIIVVASVTLRLILTRERLTALVVPRIEQAVQAKITIEDIGIRFPFGFGVDVKGLSFTRGTPGGQQVVFTADGVVVRASLLSLLRRKPEVSRFEVAGGGVELADPERAARVELTGLQARASVTPLPEGFSLDPDIVVERVVLHDDKKGSSLGIDDVGFRGSIETDEALTRLEVRDAVARWGDAVEAALSGSITELKTSRRFSFDISCERIDLPRLLDRVISLGPGLVPPALAGKDGPPVRLEAGTARLDASIEGSLAKPAGSTLSGSVRLEGVEARHPILTMPLLADGSVDFSRERASSKDLALRFGKSKAAVGFDATLDIATKKVADVRFSAGIDLDIGEAMGGVRRPEGQDTAGKIAAAGTARADLRGGSSPAVLAALFPSGDRPTTAEQIKLAWQQVDLEGSVAVSGASFSAEGNPLRISSMRAEAAVDGGSVHGLVSSFELGGVPYRIEGEMKNLLPALAETALKSRQRAGGTVDLGAELDAAVNAPAISVKLEGRSFDLRPMEEEAKREKEEKRAGGRGGERPEAGGEPAQDNPLMPVILKNTSFTAALDSVLSTKGVLTDLRIAGSIRDGVLRADPVTMAYAGGRGRAVINANLRTPDRIKSSVDVSFDEIDAGRALSGFHSMGRLVEGRFSFRTSGDLLSGRDVDPLATLEARGNALSSSGTVDFTPFISGLGAEGMLPLDLSKFEKVPFKEWKGNFLVKNSRLITEDWRLRSSNGDWAIAGSFGFDGTLDYRARLVVPPSVQQGMKDLAKYRDLVDLFRDENGNLVLDFEVGGTSKSPKMKLDTSAAQRRAGEKVVDEIKDKASDWLKKRLR